MPLLKNYVHQLKRPRFMEKKGLTYAERGTASSRCHAALLI